MKFYFCIIPFLFIGHFVDANNIKQRDVLAFLNNAILESSNNLKFNNCTSDEEDKSCTAIFVTNQTCQPSVPQWIYTTNISATDYYPLNGFSVNITGNEYTMTMTLDPGQYYAAFYIAQVACPNNATLTQSSSFQVVNTTGSPLNGQCNSTHDCNAFNSKCSNNTCQCGAAYPVQDSGSDFTSACLQTASIGSECLVTAQCQAISTETVCKIPDGSMYGTCSCHSPYVTKYIKETGTIQCIIPEGYYDDCTYDEECNYYDSHMICTSYGCDCEYGYYYDYWGDYCAYNPWTAYLSITAVIGIVFGVIFLVILIFVAFALCIRSRARPTRPPVSTSPQVVWTADGAGQPDYTMDNPPNYMEAGGFDSPPPPFESEIVIKTRLEDPPADNLNNNPFHQQDGFPNQLEPQEWGPPQYPPPQLQQQQLDLYVPTPPPRQVQQQAPLTNSDEHGNAVSNDSFFFNSPKYHVNLSYDADADC